MSTAHSGLKRLKMLSVFVAVIMCTCGKPHLKLPLKEIYRPLTHPQRVHGIRLGLPPRLLQYTKNGLKYDFNGPLVQILPGYVKLTEKLELNFPVEIYLKYFLIKNTETKNGELHAAGPNWAVYGGGFFIGVAPGEGPMFKEAFGTTFKHLLSENIWVEGNGEIYLRNILGKKKRHIPSMHLFTGTGIQLTQHLAVTAGFLMDGVHTGDSTAFEYGIPFRFQWHVNHTFSVSFTTGPGHHQKWGPLFGFDAAVYW